MTIATDIIAAFPTETDEHFQETMDLINRHRFAIMNYTQFYPRPGTPAAKMKRVMTTKDARRRTKQISEVFESWDPYAELVGKRCRVWITEEMARDKVHMIGHTKNYTQVLIACDTSLFGSSVEVNVTRHGRWSIFGDVIEGTAKHSPVAPVVLHHSNAEGPASLDTQFVDTHGNTGDACCDVKPPDGTECCSGVGEDCACASSSETVPNALTESHANKDTAEAVAESASAETPTADSTCGKQMFKFDAFNIALIVAFVVVWIAFFYNVVQMVSN